MPTENYRNSFLMADKNEELIRELHERLMKEFMKQISESISNIREPIVENKTDVRENDSEAAPAIKEVPAPPQEEHSGPDKINEIRNEVAATQSAEPLSPDKQSELMEIVKQRSEEFERELHRIASEDNNTIESEAQKFKDELMDNARKQLTEKKNAFAD